MTMPPSCVQALGMTRYRPDTFAQMRAMMVDAHKLHTTYEEFLRAAEQQAKRTGVTVVRAYLDPDTFPAFCRERGLNLVAKGRMEYGIWVAYQALTGGKPGDA